jgi:hypothetical protein
MTRDELNGVKALLPTLAIKHLDPQPFADVIGALEQARAKLAALESNGLTEEMLRNHDGYLKINRGVVLVSERYLAELQREHDDAIKDGLVQAVKIDELTMERDALQRKVAELQEFGL